jgi:hypothetical protein
MGMKTQIHVQHSNPYTICSPIDSNSASMNNRMEEGKPNHDSSYSYS